MYVTTVRLPDELAERVKLYCARTGATVNGAVVVAVEALVGGGLAGSGADALRGVRDRAPDPASSSSQVRPDFKPGMKP